MILEEMRAALETKKAEARTLNNDNKVEEAEAALAEVRNLSKQIKIQEELEQEELRDLQKQKNIESRGNKEMEKINEMRALTKAVLGQQLAEEERAVIKTTDNAAVLPAQFINKLQEIKKGFGALKFYCDVIPVTKNSGSMPVVDLDQNAALKDIAEGDAIADGSMVTTSISFNCSKVGLRAPLSSELVDDAEIDIQNAVEKNFAELSTTIENKRILTAINTNATEVTATDYTALEDVMAKALPSVKAGLVTLCNVEGYALLKNMKDKNARNLNLVTVDASGVEYFNGKPIITFDSSLVAPSEGKTIVFYSLNMVEAVKFFDRTNGYTVKRYEDNDTDTKKMNILERLDVKAGITRSIKKIEL